MQQHISPLAVPQLLTPYLLSRWCCGYHGFFEMGTAAPCHALCPECGDPADFVEDCRGWTVKALPFISKPRRYIDPENSKWQINNSKGLTGRVRADGKSERLGGRRSTGRPKREAKQAPRKMSAEEIAEIRSGWRSR